MSLPVTDVIISWADQKTTRRPGKFDNDLLCSPFKTLNRTKPNQKRLKYKTLQKHGLIHVGKESREEKVQLKISEDNRDDNKVTVSLSLTNIVVWVLKTPCLIYFPSIKFHFAEETQMTFYSIGEKCCSISAQKMAKNIFQVFDTDSDMKVHAFYYAN